MVTIEIDVLSVKSLHEDLCLIQSALSFYPSGDQTTRIKRVGELIDQLEVMRPLGPDGKHGNRHTRLCGCEDVTSYERPWTIWGEGYRATGEYGDATYMGTEYAETFDEAVQKLKEWYPNPELFRRHEDGHWTYWACRLFDNEKDARKSFG